MCTIVNIRIDFIVSVDNNRHPLRRLTKPLKLQPIYSTVSIYCYNMEL